MWVNAACHPRSPSGPTYTVPIRTTLMLKFPPLHSTEPPKSTVSIYADIPFNHA